MNLFTKDPFSDLEGKEYFWRVRGFDTECYSLWSPVYNFKISNYCVETIIGKIDTFGNVNSTGTNSRILRPKELLKVGNKGIFY